MRRLRCRRLCHSLGRRRKQPGQFAESDGATSRLAELEPNLQVAPVKIELGNLVFLQELDQLF
jgi:DNA polymerase I-like protein with 3'-5' exonuclease and polymerase domains